MEGVVFGICLDCSDYERRCASCEFLAHNREETVFVFAGLHWVVFLFQGPSPYRAREAKLRGLRPIMTSYPSLDIVKSNSAPATSRRVLRASSLAHDKRRPLIPTPVFPFRRRQFLQCARNVARRRSKTGCRTRSTKVFPLTTNRQDFPRSRPCEHLYSRS
jgi:hypothetical protein